MALTPPIPQSTSETVHQLLQQHSATVAALQRRLQLLSALAQPDPAPQPWHLNLRTEATHYFLTELPDLDSQLDSDRSMSQASQQGPDAAAAAAAGSLSGSGGARLGQRQQSQRGAKPKLFAEGLGLGPDVPRFLRWDEPVELQELSCQETERQVGVTA